MFCLTLPLIVIVLWFVGAITLCFRKWKIASLLIAACLLLNWYSETIALRPFFGQGDGQIKVMTFNVNSPGTDFEKKKSEIIAQIEAEDPDFLYLPELGTAGNEVHERLKAAYPFTNAPLHLRDDGVEPFYSKWPIDTIIGLSDPHAYHSIYRMQVSQETDTLAIYCCHLSSNLLDFSPNKLDALQKGYDERAKEADILYDALTHEKYPAIVMGDMNDISGSYTLRKIESAGLLRQGSAGLTDAWWEGGFGYGTTYHDHGLRLRLDHILYDEDRLTLSDVKVIDTDASDHNALVGGFRIEV